MNDQLREPSKSASDRLVALDAARFLAAIAIIWQHTPESQQLKPFGSLGAFAVPFFIAVSILMTAESVRRKPDRGFAPYALARFKRIYIPFLIWTAIYLVIRNLKHKLLTHEPVVWFSPGMLIGGSAHHLWFLPFLFIVSLIVFAIARVMNGRSTIEWLVFAIAIVAGTIVAFMPEDLFANRYLLDRAWAATPAVLWGIALAGIYRHIPRPVWRSPTIPIVGVILLLACLAPMVMKWHSHLTENLAGIGLMLIALYDWPTKYSGGLSRFGALAYGIYLSHVMFIEGMQAVAARGGIHQAWWLDLVIFALATIGAILFTKVISRFPLNHWLVPA